MDFQPLKLYRRARIQRRKPKFPGLVVFGRPHDSPPLALSDLDRECDFVPPLDNDELLG